MPTRTRLKNLVLKASFLFGVAVAMAGAHTALAAPGPRPQVDRGIALQLLPKGIAEVTGQKWGLGVLTHQVPRSTVTGDPVFQSAPQLIEFVQRQDPSVQENGVWIVLTNSRAYSAEELNLLEDIKDTFRRRHIPLFVARTAELPGGWRRYDTRDEGG